MKRIAIIGSGTAGIVQAIALRKKIDSSVEIHLFEREASFDLSKGVELSVGVGFQIVMSALGCDMTPELERYGYRHSDASVADCMGNTIPHVERLIHDTGIYTGADATGLYGEKICLRPYCINRGIFMSLLQKKLARVNSGFDSIHWGFKLCDITSTDKRKKVLHFTNGEEFSDVDLLVGADGVHSKVRELIFDHHQAKHTGANILYGVIDKQIDIFNDDKFNIICSDKFTMVSCCYKNLDESLATWWAIVYPDQQEHLTQKKYRAFWESQANVKQLAHQLVSTEPSNSYPKQYVEKTTEFKYSGFFLERDPNTLKRWGLDNTVLIGDAVHAMQPWAGIGASMAAEDGYMLAELIAHHGFDDLQNVFDELQANRIQRIRYYYQITLNNTPKGLLPKDLSIPVEKVTRSYGNQKMLESSPAWQEMIQSLSIPTAA